MAASAILATADSLRRHVLRLGAPVFGRLYGDRAARIAFVGSLAVLLALGVCMRFPLALFALGPLVLGVPHLLADVRYLVVLPQAHRRPWLVLFVLLPLAATFYSPTLKVGLVSVVGAALVARTTLVRKLLGIFGASALYALALVAPASFSLLFAHAHNFIAAIVLLAFSRSVRHALAPVALFLVASFALLSGVLDGFLVAAADSALPTGADLGTVLAQYAPFCESLPVALRFIVLFVFAQSVHYTIWLRLLPDEARSKKGLRTFQGSFQALRNDLGLLPLALALLGATVFAVWGLRSLESARLGYLQVAAFHGYLELAFLMLLFLEGRQVWLPKPAEDVP